MPGGRPISPAQIARMGRYTQWPRIVEANFDKGVVTDTPAVNLPMGAVPAANDYLFDRPGIVRKRGGTAYQSNVLGTPSGTTPTLAVFWADFTAGSKLIAVAFDTGTGQERIFDATSGSSVNTATAGSAQDQRPVLYNDAVIQVGGFAPKKITNVSGTLTVGSWGGSPPEAYYAVNHGGYLVLGNTDSNPNRIWFSPIPDPESAWDTSNAYIDTATEITGLASVQGVLMIFHKGSTERVIGSIPPGTVGENMSLQPVSAHTGCMDARTIETLDANVFFADQNGIWVTNGAGVRSISSKPNGMGISSSWRSLASIFGSSAEAVGGTFGSDYYMCGFVSALLSNNILFVYHIPTGNWSRFKGVSGTMMTAKTGDASETYLATGSNRIVKLSDCFAATPANKTDADGTAVLPTITTRALGDGPSYKSFGQAHITYDMRDAASDNPTMTMTLLTGIEEDASSSTITESPLVETTTAARKRFTINKRAQAVALTFTQTAASSKTEIYALELDVRPFSERAETGS